MKRRSATVPTRDRILDEVERLIAVKGVHGFKLRGVSERLQLQVPAIYKHYGSRDEVLVEVSRRFVNLLGGEFSLVPTRSPSAALRAGLDHFVEFKMFHPAYVRLALIDFAAPGGGMEYVKKGGWRFLRAQLFRRPAGGHARTASRPLASRRAHGAFVASTPPISIGW